ncbi:flavin monoamine oxidase family protein [Sphingomonas sp.]|uniref:flavin monoamine oxidase family protein n=1 Tax=Sphingomonas sp. TaxID=28214 RepID=UPI003CC674FA
MTDLTAVIGAGAAGIAAARRLHDAGRDVLLLEASDRLGGRAHSVTLATGHTVDRGCGWLHSARRNPWAAIAGRKGFIVDRSSPHWDEQWRDLGFPAAEQAAFGRAWDRWDSAARAALNGPDQPLSAFVAADDPWRPQLDAISGYANGAPLDAVSLHDWAAYEGAATEDNWSVVEGYGTLVAAHAAGLPVRLSTPVTRVDHRGRSLRLETAAGTIEAARVIVAVPTTVLASGALAFDPPLPAKQEAAADLPLGLADKVFLRADGPLPWPAHAHLLGKPCSSMTASYRLSPFGWPIVEAFFGGACAETLEKDDPAAFAVDELVALLGSEWRARLTPLMVTRWRHEPWIGGSYSHARIGRAGQRQVLAEAVDDRMFFAGEACHRSDFSTCHGAYETGLAAAEAILRPGGGGWTATDAAA